MTPALLMNLNRSSKLDTTSFLLPLSPAVVGVDGGDGWLLRDLVKKIRIRLKLLATMEFRNQTAMSF